MKLELTEKEVKLMNKFLNKKDFSKKPCFVLEIEGKINRLYGTDGWHIFAVEQVNELLTNLPEGRYLINSNYFKPKETKPITIENIQFDKSNKFKYQTDMVELEIERLEGNRANYLDWRGFKYNKEFTTTHNIALNINLLKFVISCMDIYNKDMYHRVDFDVLGKDNDETWKIYYIEQGDTHLEFFGDIKIWALIMSMRRD